MSLEISELHIQVESLDLGVTWALLLELVLEIKMDVREMDIVVVEERMKEVVVCKAIKEYMSIHLEDRLALHKELVVGSLVEELD